MPLIRKRRAADQDPESDDSSPETPPTHRHQRRREETSPEAEADMSDEEDGQGASSLNAMVQKMVRLALSSEFARLPIRRADVSAKVLGEQGTRQFKPVFQNAQRLLRDVFGMEMIELPGREKVTISQRRAAQKTEKPHTSNKSWILTSTLPRAYRVPEILTPTRAPSTATESTYTALYSFIIAVISLNGGSLGEQKLERYLARTNADTYTPIDRTDRFLQRLCKEGYLVRTRENDGGEEIVEYMVGPRGKVEVGSGGVAGLAREVYGYGPGSGPGGDELTAAEREQQDEFEARLKRSLGITAVRREEEEEEKERGENGNAEESAAVVRRRSSRRANADEEESEEEEEVDSD